MNQLEQTRSGTTLRDALAVIRQRKQIVILCALLVPAAALVFSLLQKPAYQGQADVLLSQKNLAASLTNLQDQSIQASNADRVAQTQAELAKTPIVARNTLKALGIKDMTATELLEATDVSSSQNSDILVFKITDHDRVRARKLVNEYAEQYTLFRTKIDTGAIAHALTEVDRQLTGRQGRRAEGALRNTLLEKREQLRTLLALQTSNSYVVRVETKAEQVRPTPMRNTVLGVILGLMLGVALAFAFDALDTRLRTAEEIAEAIGAPLLVRVPLEGDRGEAPEPLMIAEPNSPDTEAYRLLRSNLEFASLGNDARTILFTSAVENEGKSTTVANLAVAHALAGKRVCLADLDLRHPSVERMFNQLPGRGVTDIAVGNASLDEALVQIKLSEAGKTAAANGSGPDGEKTASGLWLLPCGAIPPDPGEFVSTQALAAVVGQLRERFDLVLIDTPPLLRVGDPITLSKNVDGIVVVGRRGVLHTGMASEIRRLLSAAPARTLGVVVIGGGSAERGYGYGGYGYGYGYGYPSEETRIAPEGKPAALSD